MDESYRQTPEDTDTFIRQLVDDCRDAPEKVSGTTITLFRHDGEKEAVLRIAVQLLEDIGNGV